MKRVGVCIAAFALMASHGGRCWAADEKAKADAEGFVSLFDGKTLTGWHGDQKLWKVEDGAIVGHSDGKIKHNTFLISDKKYTDFVLKFSFKLEGGNSGMQFRSEEKENFRVAGFQADMAPEYWGLLYDEMRPPRGILVKAKPEDLKKADVKPDGWNHYTVTAKGDSITFDLNGVKVMEYTEKDPKIPREGILAMQLHAGPPMTARFKDIKIKLQK